MGIDDRIKQKNLAFAKKGIIWAIIGGILYGISPLFLTLAMEEEPLKTGSIIGVLAVPFIIAGLQDLLAGFWVLIPNLINGKEKEYLRVLKSKPGRVIILASFCGGLVAMAGFTTGVYLAGPVYPVAISATFPAVGAIIARIFLKEKITTNGWIGIVMCVLGAIVISWENPSGETYPMFYLGIIGAVIASIGWSLEAVISCAGMDFVDPEIALGIRQFASGLMFLLTYPFIAGFGLTVFELFVRTIPSMAFIYVAIAAFSSGISYYFYYKANSACGVSRGMAINISYTLVSAILAVLFLGSSLTWNLIIGMAILLSGAVLVVGKPSDLLTLRTVNQD